MHKQIVVVVIALAGCGGRQKQANAEMQDFRCRDRFAIYTVKHHIGGELGVQLDCADAGPRISRWRVERDGTRQEDARGMTPGEFDKVWGEIDSSGWALLKDCTTGSLGEKDPLYQFRMSDDQQQGEFKCQSVTLPFPYNTIVDALDMAASQGRKQLGDPEPDDLKQYDKKDKQR
jgi:hypothetical protein